MSRSVESAFAEARLRALEILVGASTADSDRAEQLIAALDQDRAEPGHDGHAHKAIGHAEKRGPVPRQLRQRRAVAVEHRCADGFCLRDLRRYWWCPVHPRKGDQEAALVDDSHSHADAKLSRF